MATNVDLDDLSNNLSALLDKMKDVLSSLPDAIAQYKIDSITIDVEISAEGSVSLLGTGGKLGGNGGISFVLKRGPSSLPTT